MKLYDMVLQFLRTLFLRTRNVHYCTLRAELLMSLHDLDVGDICSVDPCHKVAPSLSSGYLGGGGLSPFGPFAVWESLEGPGGSASTRALWGEAPEQSQWVPRAAVPWEGLRPLLRGPLPVLSVSQIWA